MFSILIYLFEAKALLAVLVFYDTKLMFYSFSEIIWKYILKCIGLTRFITVIKGYKIF